MKKQTTAVASIKDSGTANLIQLAIEKGTSIEQLQALLQMQNEWNKEKARMDFLEAFSKFQSDVKPVLKTSKVQYTTQRGTTNFKFAPLSEIIASIMPTLSDCGLSVRWENKDNGTHLEVTCIVSHISGHSISCSMSGEPDTSGGKNNIQAKGSTMTYLQRYTMNMALAISTEDDNDGAGASQQASKRIPTSEQFEIIKTKFLNGEITLNKIADHFTLTDEQIKQLKK